jgi:hypothetical protein
MGDGSLARELSELVRMEMHIQTLNDESAAILAGSYIEDNRGVSLINLAGLVVAGWNRLNVHAIISFARAISARHPEFLEMVRGRRFRGLLAKSWVSSFPELPASRALVARLERENTVYDEALAAGETELTELQLLLIGEVVADNAAGFAATLGARDPELWIYRVVCPELFRGPSWRRFGSLRVGVGRRRAHPRDLGVTLPMNCEHGALEHG